MRILVTGATGYIGGRLVSELLRAGRDVKVLVRHAERIRDRSWYGDVEVSEGDLSSGRGLASLGTGVEAAYYLVHSRGAGDGYAARAPAPHAPAVRRSGGLLAGGARRAGEAAAVAVPR